MAEASEPFGERLRRLRRARGVSLRELAGSGCSFAYIARVETGARIPSLKIIRHLAKGLGVTPEYLETGDGLTPREALELRLASAELEARLGGETNAPGGIAALLEDAMQIGDPVLTARAHALLGLVAFAGGDHAQAIEHLEAARSDPTVTPVLRPDVFAALGRSRAFAGDPALAVELFSDCLQVVADGAPDELATRMRYVRLLSTTLAEAGDGQAARAVLADAALGDGGAHDLNAQGKTYWALGRRSLDAGESPLALAYLRRALALLTASEDGLELGRGHLSNARLLVQAGRAPEAAPSLAAAARLLALDGSAADIGALRTAQAWHAIETADPEGGATFAREALQLLRDLPTGVGEALWALASAQVALGEIETASATFAQAVDALEEEGRFDEAYRACREWGGLLRANDRPTEAFDVLDRATHLAAQ